MITSLKYGFELLLFCFFQDLVLPLKTKQTKKIMIKYNIQRYNSRPLYNGHKRRRLTPDFAHWLERDSHSLSARKLQTQCLVELSHQKTCHTHTIHVGGTEAEKQPIC